MIASLRCCSDDDGIPGGWPWYAYERAPHKKCRRIKIHIWAMIPVPLRILSENKIVHGSPWGVFYDVAHIAESFTTRADGLDNIPQKVNQCRSNSDYAPEAAPNPLAGGQRLAFGGQHIFTANRFREVDGWRESPQIGKRPLARFGNPPATAIVVILNLEDGTQADIIHQPSSNVGPCHQSRSLPETARIPQPNNIITHVSRNICISRCEFC